jgi:hypothetical protein
MTFRWRMLLGVAVRLTAGSRPGESEHRTAINRAYYAALGEAREYAERHGLVINRRRSSHEQVWQFLRGSPSGLPAWHRAALKSIGDTGVDLRTLRVQADYHLAPPAPSTDVQRAVGMAKTIIERLHALP